MNRYHLGVSALERCDFGRAIDHFTRALAIDPRDVEALAQRGLAWQRQGQIEKALADYEQALRLDPDCVHAYAHRGLLYRETGDYQRAIADFSHAIECDPHDPSLYLGRAQTYELLGDESRAAADYAQAARLDLGDEPSGEASSRTRTAVRETVSWHAHDTPPVGAFESGAIKLEVDEAPAEAVGVATLDAPHEAATVLPMREPARRPKLFSAAWLLGMRSGLASAAVHAVILVVLGCIFIGQKIHPGDGALLATEGTDEEGVEHLGRIDFDAETIAELVGGQVVETSKEELLTKPVVNPQVTAVELPVADLAMTDLAPARMANQLASASDMMRELNTTEPTNLARSRSAEGRRAAVLARGGSYASEAAVAKALDWLARHQLGDGSWSFDHRLAGQCKGACSHPGSLDNVRIASTALALLPFLGAGETHRAPLYGESGKYRKNVQIGLAYLLRHMQTREMEGAMTEPAARMYDHGLASIALCELYAMTHDKDLIRPCGRALKFIAAAQDQVGGGWRYFPGQAGDTSVTAWYLMALKSAHMAELKVSPMTVERASRFLDSVQQDKGSGYGYVNPTMGTRATTAAGLLCRMYLGWKHDEPALVRGVESLSAFGPSSDDMYYNYYATQVLHHYEGPLWTQWNEQMRDPLIAAQARVGHEAGSWYFEGDRHGSGVGGRLYCTALAAVTLEVYYRHMPLYSKRTTEGGLGK
jgi:tetratricopeptide (TPR) repeat protein